MADVDMADVAALRPLAAHRLMDRPEGRSPAHDRQPAAGVAKANILLGHMVGDAVHLRLADVGHRLVVGGAIVEVAGRSEGHTSELQSLMRFSYAVFCLKPKQIKK